MQGKSVESTLMAPVKLQESVLVTCGKAPQKFNIPCFD